jgi:hypothetical protein
MLLRVDLGPQPGLDRERLRQQQPDTRFPDVLTEEIPEPAGAKFGTGVTFAVASTQTRTRLRLSLPTLDAMPVLSASVVHSQSSPASASAAVERVVPAAVRESRLSAHYNAK